jgi:N-acetylmuramoyl-L-alanine amidase
MQIAIDPGHGGVDGGASLGEHFNEKDINLDISLKLKELLVNSGAEVVLTRDSDMSLEKMSDLQSSRYRRDLDARRDIVNRSSAKLCVSIHSNCFRTNPQAKGAIVFYYYSSEEGKKLARFIGDSIDKIVYRGHLKNNTLKSKVLSEDLFILRSIDVPGVLVEAGYMTNQEEGRLMRQDEFQAAMAEAIYDGLKNYLKPPDQ